MNHHQSQTLYTWFAQTRIATFAYSCIAYRLIQLKGGVLLCLQYTPIACHFEHCVAILYKTRIVTYELLCTPVIHTRHHSAAACPV